MFNYMTPLTGVDASSADAATRTYAAEGHDLPSLLYKWLDELLFDFSSDFFVPIELKITKFDREEWKIEADGRGEPFDRARHVSGTEIKAITYSAMQINEKEGDAEVFVIVDI
jgi:SHS2 domain-containing protein